MRASFIFAALALACTLTLPFSEPVQANACASYPSSDCPARGVQPGAASYPCFGGQIKGDWYRGRYYTPGSVSYAGIGSGPGSDVWCFNYVEEAEGLGFSP